MKNGKRVVAAFIVAGALGMVGLWGRNVYANQKEGAAGSVSERGLKQGAYDVETEGAAYENGWERPEKETEYVYCVASVSKVYVTAAVMQLADEGKVKLEDPITEYLPEFSMADDRYRKITVRMLMDHTSGIMGTTQKGAFLYGTAAPIHHEELFSVLGRQRLKSEPGEFSAYCNDGFDLLERIVESVTGKSYAQYVKENLAAPLGAKATGTGNEIESLQNLAPAYTAKGLRYENEASMSLGAGGIYATAADAARFGSAFFEGDHTLLSEGAKKEMGKCWNQGDAFMDQNGLGWDEISFPRYEKAGVIGYGKGGDVKNDHAYLMVAPKEKVSVAVLSNGGSSTLNGLLAEAIMDVCLEEMGIVIPKEPKGSCEIVSEIPAEYDAFAGDYVTSNALAGGDQISRVTFPDHKYMHVEMIGAYRTSCMDYVLTKEGSFAQLTAEVADSGLEDARIAMNPEILSFVTAASGQVYIACVKKEVMPEFGEHVRKTYVGERLKENKVSDAAQSSWQEICGVDLLLDGEIWSSQNYDTAITNLVMTAEAPGYVFFVNGMGTRLLRIKDEAHAVSFLTVPSSTGRDQVDAELIGEGEERKLLLSTGLDYVVGEGLSRFDGKEKTISLKTGKATWYFIDDAIANGEVSIASRPESSAVYVYSRYGEVLYSTHVVDASATLPMPKGGKIVFLGEDGGSVELN